MSRNCTYNNRRQISFVTFRYNQLKSTAVGAILYRRIAKKISGADLIYTQIGDVYMLILFLEGNTKNDKLARI